MNSTPSVTSSSSEKSNALPSNLTQSSTISYSSVKFIDEFSDNDYDDSEEEFDVDYLCPECSRPRTNDRWCNFCESKKFSMNFDKWTSGNSYLDKIIRDTQLNATNKCDYLVWINYNEFEDVEYLAKGGYGEVYYGVWVYGPDKVLIYEEENCKWRKEAKTPVALKCLHNSKNITADFLDELKMYYRCRNGRVLHCYGITQHNESNNYMMVMEYANGGDLRHYFKYNYHLLSWGQKLRILRDIALGLEVIHSTNLIHRDLHSGNLLLHTLKDGTMRTFVTDLGLCRPIDKSSKSEEMYGVLPYIAPELLRRDQFYTKSSDIYSFGIIMWEVLIGKLPFYDIPHDAHLVMNICLGKRPTIDIKETPEWYIDLMEKCWDNEPKNRPDILEIRLLLNKRYWECLESDEYAINLPQNKGNARERRIIKSHPKAVYTSRLLPKPLNDKVIEYSGYGNFAISESDFIKGIGRTIGQLQQLKIITDENSEDSDYVTRAFEQSLSIGNNISNTSKRAKITNTSKAL